MNLFERIDRHTEPRIYMCEREWYWRSASMPDYDLWCVLSGCGEMRIDGARSQIIPGSSWLFFPGVSIEALHDPDNRLRVFSVHIGFPDGLDESPSLMVGQVPARPTVIRNLTLLEALAHGCVQASRVDHPVCQQQVDLSIRHILLLMLQEAGTTAGRPIDSRISRVLQAVMEDPAYPWTVAGMAHLARMSRSHFSRLFHRETGQSPTKCLLEARIGRASQLLHETDLRVGEIANRLGYRDIFYFSRQFKALRGQSPLAFRQSAARFGDGEGHALRGPVPDTKP